MKTTILLFTLLIATSLSWGQKLLSGDFGCGLKLAYDYKNNLLTGYFESHTGWDEETNNFRFSCIFYIEGVEKDNLFRIQTYYPECKSKDNVEGTLEIINNRTVKIRLTKEHGGCWNVQHFADSPEEFELVENVAWIQIRYVNTDKTFFYSDKSIDKKQKAYIIKNDLLFVEKIEGDWAYCIFNGKKETKGWVKTADLNEI